ncbi:Uncharacterised protein [Fusobacterium varium]|nr:hypothetical protein [Fusobacterium varium]VEH39242.1 Uncharacterised protein [Fusobacterium varium]
MFHFFESIDIQILFFIQEHYKTSLFDKLMPIITKLGNIGIFWIVLACIFIFIKKYRKIGIMILSQYFYVHYLEILFSNL